MMGRLGTRHDTHAYVIATAGPDDLVHLPAIELAAARLLSGYAPDTVLNETTSLDVLRQAQRESRVWVALDANLPVGFAHVELIEPRTAHLEELDVAPAHGRRGLGTRLVLTVCEWAAHHGYDAVTLTTFRDVPWNMPFYARLGFDIVSSRELTPALAAVVEDETRRGLDPARRVVMRRTLRQARPLPSAS
jgi:GNAT superfamily N-acetyltransferase